MSERTKMPPKCRHCDAREPTDEDGFCLDYQACITRKPLGANKQTLSEHEPNPEATPEPIILPDGTELTEEKIEELADQAERGYDIPHKHSRRWPPPLRGTK